MGIGIPMTTNTIQEFLKALCNQMNDCLKTLLEEKLLFQNSTVDLKQIQLHLPPEFSIGLFQKAVEYFKETPIILTDKTSSPVYGLLIYAPETVCTECEFCKGERTPHNPLQVSSAGNYTGEGSDQTFSLYYRCQKCKQGSLVFLVRRRKLKLQLVGRSQIPSANLPNYFPNKQIALFNDAEMAFRTGSHLASVCLLRIALEQYMRTETGTNEVCSGDDLWSRFKMRLPKDFPMNRVCSLGEVYGILSNIMHTPALLADESYTDCKGKLDAFFKFLALMPLVEPDSAG